MTGEFYVALDRGTATEEKIKVLSRSGTTLTLASAAKRGQDGTTAASHTSGAPVEHIHAAQDSDEANYTANQTVGKATTAEDLLVATGNAAFKRLGKGADSTVLQVVTGALGYALVGTGNLATDAVTTAKILDANVTTGKIADLAVTQAKMLADLRVPVVCTSSTRPASPVEGDHIYETDTDRTYRYGGAAWINDHASVNLTQAAGLTVGHNSTGPSLFDSEEHDTDAMWTTAASSRITFNSPGVYVVTGTITFEANPGGTRALWIALNGNVNTRLAQSESPGQSTNSIALSVTTVRSCIAGDYVQLIPYQTTGGNLVTSTNSPRFSAVRVGSA